MIKSNLKTIIAIIIILAMGGFGTYLRSHQSIPERPADFSRLPMVTEKYFGAEHRFEEYTYEVLKADTSTLRQYRDNEGNSYWLFMAYFSSQKYGAQIHSPKHCLPGGGFKIASIEPYIIDFSDGSNITVNRLLIANERRKELMIYWYETRSGVISKEVGLKLDLMQNSIKFLPTDAAICRVTVPLPLDADFAVATELAVDFIREFYPAMTEALPFAQN